MYRLTIASLLTVLMVAQGAATQGIAQEPKLLPPPKAKKIDAAPMDATPMVDGEQGQRSPDEVVGGGAYGHEYGAYGDAYGSGDAQFGGYPYSGGWHAGYQHPYWGGGPVALVVPPVSHYQTIWNWQVAGTQITPIYPQYSGPTQGNVTGFGDGQYQYPPYWPWDTRQFGVYYIRGPW